jgi:P-type Ca2+ transporter type 2C
MSEQTLDLNREEKKPWHSMSIEEAFQALDTGRKGLTQEEAKKRLEEYGRNEVAKSEDSGWLRILLHQLINPLVAVLVIAAVIALLAGEVIDTIVIVVVILVNTAIGFFQEYRAESAIEALRSRAAPLADVLRCENGDRCTDISIDTAEIVPGDVILLEAGDRIAADARIFEAANLEIDESMLTGESLTVSKSTEPLEGDLAVADRTNLAYGGTIVTEGRGKAVVYATANNTQLGEIASLIQETEKAVSPLQKQTVELGKRLGFLAFGAGLLILIMAWIRGLELQEVFLFSLAAVVSAIPEGLPAVMTITLAVGVNRMAKRNAIIRRLQAVDTLGATTVISTDKTGTLTTNQMTVQKMLVGGKLIEVTGLGFEPQGEFNLNGDSINPREDDDLHIALQIAALTNDSRLVHEEGEGEDRWSIRGDPTEGALIVAARKAGLDKPELEGEYPRIDEIPFSSQKKFMATFHGTPDGTKQVYLKGAPETVLDFCSSIRKDGEVIELDQEQREAILEANHQMAEGALRVLGVAYQKLDDQVVDQVKESLDEGQGELVFAGLFGMIDPPREEVFEAIQRCKRAGIRVIMATGDHQVTGEAIGRQVGILEGDGRVCTGTQIDKLSDEELDEIILDTAVFARVSPAHKQRIVSSLQRHGEVVAMTGDGVNDAPALKAAEIGVAMGITGTDVTKETAEMVLTDDNFASIVNAAEEGRVVFQNVRKVVKFLISTNAGEILTIIGAIFLLPVGQLIFTPVQILWVNLVTDGLLDITIALEPKEGDVMNEPPRRPNARIINRSMLYTVLFVATIMAIGTLGVYLYIQNSAGAERAQTMAFITIAMFQVFNSLNVRSLDKSLFEIGVFTNKYLIGAIIISVTLLYLATIVPFMQVALNTMPLRAADWGLIVLVTSSIFILTEIWKFVRRRIRRDN